MNKDPSTESWYMRASEDVQRVSPFEYTGVMKMFATVGVQYPYLFSVTPSLNPDVEEFLNTAGGVDDPMQFVTYALELKPSGLPSDEDQPVCESIDLGLLQTVDDEDHVIILCQMSGVYFVISSKQDDMVYMNSHGIDFFSQKHDAAHNSVDEQVASPILGEFIPEYDEVITLDGDFVTIAGLCDEERDTFEAAARLLGVEVDEVRVTNPQNSMLLNQFYSYVDEHTPIASVHTDDATTSLQLYCVFLDGPINVVLDCGYTGMFMSEQTLAFFIGAINSQPRILVEEQP